VTDQPLPDIAAFEALFATHGARMKSLAFNMLRNRSDAEDAVQEAFLKAYSRRHTFRSDAQLWTWVYRILLNACYDAGRRRAVRGVEEEIDPGGTLLQSQGRDHPLRVALQRALGTLSPLYREVFLLCEVEGYTHRETAAILDIPEGTSKGRLFEARRQLKDALRGVTTTSATTRVGS
jgi:RNA polymerase sigma-70 factor (ECF subfamily)